MAHPFADIRDGRSGGRGLLRAALEAFAAQVPVAKIREEGLAGVHTWEAWAALREGLEAVFTAADGPLHFVTRRGVDRGSEIAALRMADPDSFAVVPARERAARWAEQYGARHLLTGPIQIRGRKWWGETAKTRAGIANLISRALRGEDSQREAARRIMAVRGFGLDPRREVQLQRAVETWELEGKSAKLIRRKTRALHKRLLFRRASAVWQYNKRSAIYEGARQAWAEMQSVGQLVEGQLLVWDHAGAAPGHPCPRCGSLIGTTTGIVSDFEGQPVEGGGRRYNGRRLTRRRPPEHPG